MRAFSVRLLIAALVCLLLAPAAQAHHAAFYKALFEAIDDGDLEAVRKLFSDQAWTNSDNKSAASGAALHARLKAGELWFINGSSEMRYTEWGGTEEDRTRCAITFELKGADDESGQEYWLLGKRIGEKSNRKPEVWQVVKIVNTKAEAGRYLGRDWK